MLALIGVVTAGYMLAQHLAIPDPVDAASTVVEIQPHSPHQENLAASDQEDNFSVGGKPAAMADRRIVATASEAVTDRPAPDREGSGTAVDSLTVVPVVPISRDEPVARAVTALPTLAPTALPVTPPTFTSAVVSAPPSGKLSTPSVAYWQAGFRVGGFLARRSTLVQLFRLADPSPVTRSFFIDGSEISTQWVGEFVDYVPRIVHLGLVGIGMDRQFDRGLRVGLELTFASVRQSIFNSTSRLIGDQLHRNDLAVYRESWAEDYSLNVQVGYTFRRFRRLQYYAGIAVLNRFSRSGATQVTALRIRDGATFAQGRDGEPVFERSLIRDIRALPVLGAHYRVGRAYRLGLEATTEDLSVRVGYLF
jgi:hypothetical protein